MPRAKKVEVQVKPRFPIAVMAWYKQYSDESVAREGTIEYAMSLTPGLTQEVASAWVDELIRESKPEVLVI